MNNDGVWFNPSRENTPDPFKNEQKFRKSFLNEWQSFGFIDWLEDFCNQLDCDRPEMPSSFSEENKIEYYKRLGAYETQVLISTRLRYAITQEKLRKTKTE